MRNVAVVLILAAAVACTAEVPDPGPFELPDGGAPPGRAILVQGPAEFSLGLGERATLRAVVVEDGRPLSGISVRFDIEDRAPGVSLGTAEVRSDAWGRVTTTVSATDPGRFEVAASMDDGAPARWRVEVARAAFGEAVVTVPFAGEVGALPTLGGGGLLLYRGATACTDLRPRERLPLARHQEILEAPGDTLRFTPMDPGTYTVAAYFSGATHEVVMAWGCREGVSIVGGEVTRITLPAKPLPLIIVGPYSSTARYDFLGRFPGPLGDLLRSLAQVFDDRDDDGNPLRPPADDPGFFLADVILGELFDDPPRFAVELLAAIINTQVIDRIDALSRFAEVGGLLTEALTRLEVRSELVVEKLRGVGLVATERGERVTVHYRGQPFHFSLVDPRLAPEGAPSAWTATMEVDPYPAGKLRFAEHQIQVAYGRLALLVLEQVVLPLTIGASTLREALGRLVDCQRVEDALASSWLRIPAWLCEAGLDAADLLLRLGLDRLVATPGALTRKGEAVARDIDLDVSVLADELREGTWEGSLSLGGAELPYRATWSAARRGH